MPRTRESAKGVVSLSLTGTQRQAVVRAAANKRQTVSEYLRALLPWPTIERDAGTPPEDPEDTAEPEDYHCGGGVGGDAMSVGDQIARDGVLRGQRF